MDKKTREIMLLVAACVGLTYFMLVVDHLLGETWPGIFSEAWVAVLCCICITILGVVAEFFLWRTEEDTMISVPAIVLSLLLFLWGGSLTDKGFPSWLVVVYYLSSISFALLSLYTFSTTLEETWQLQLTILAFVMLHFLGSFIPAYEAFSVLVLVYYASIAFFGCAVFWMITQPVPEELKED